MIRVIHFSCGAASAVAAKIVLSRYPDSYVVNAFVAEEHPDNRRFLADVEKWICKPITVLRQERDGASAYAVIERVRYIKGPSGAACSGTLKRRVINEWCLNQFGGSNEEVAHIIGYTYEEGRRADRLRMDQRFVEFPLIDAGLTKSNCLSMIERAGIELPAMYRLGYSNANCIGCPKGGMGYWNKIRSDFPEQFARMAALEASIGESAYLFYNRKTGKRFPLTELEPHAGRHDEPAPECGLFCAMTEDEF